MSRLPRLMDAGMRELARVNPSRLSVTLNLTPPSKASMTLPDGEPVANVRQWVELYGPTGSLGLFRVTSVSTAYAVEQRVSMEHGIATLGDSLTPADKELTGTKRGILSALLGYQTTARWQLGTAPDTGSHTLKVNRTNVLQAVLSALKLFDGYALSYDFTTAPWTVHLVKLNAAPMCECRLCRNIAGVTISTDDSELFTRVYASQLPGGYLDADTTGRWDVIGRDLGVADDADAEETLAYAREFLAAHKNPVAAIEVEALELAAQTGEPLDAFRLGEMCRVALPEYQTTENKRIVSMQYGDLVSKPGEVRLSLSAIRKDLSNRITKVESDTDRLSGESTRHGSGIGKMSKKITETEYTLMLKASKEEVKGLNERLSQAEINIDGANAQITLKASREDVETLDRELGTLRSRLSKAEINIDGVKAQITLFAHKSVVDEMDNRLSYAEATLLVQSDAIISKVDKNGVISSINQTAEAVKINASKINLNGYVTASTLSSELTSLKTAFANTVSTVNLHATNVTTQNLTIGSDKVEKTFMEVVTGVHYSRETISVAAAGGGFASVVRSLNVWADTEKLWYFT